MRNFLVILFLFFSLNGFSQVGGGNGGPPCPNPPCGIGGDPGCYPPPCIPVGPMEMTIILVFAGIGLVYFLTKKIPG